MREAFFIFLKNYNTKKTIVFNKRFSKLQKQCLTEIDMKRLYLTLIALILATSTSNAQTTDPIKALEARKLHAEASLDAKKNETIAKIDEKIAKAKKAGKSTEALEKKKQAVKNRISDKKQELNNRVSSKKQKIKSKKKNLKSKIDEKKALIEY